MWLTLGRVSKDLGLHVVVVRLSVWFSCVELPDVVYMFATKNSVLWDEPGKQRDA